MKKILSIITCLFIITLTCQAQNEVGTQINLQAGYIDPSDKINQNPRSPIVPPTVYINDYTLTFTANHPEYVLYIKDEDEKVIYSIVVTSTMTEAVLPSSLSGDYEMDLIWGNWRFWGYIEL